MNLIKKLTAVTQAAVLLLGAQGYAKADALVAVGTNGIVRIWNLNTSEVTDQDKKDTIQQCTDNGGVGCRILFVVPSNRAVVVTKSNDNMNVASNSDPQKALKHSLEDCNRTSGNCRVELAKWVPYVSYAALAEADEKTTDAYYSYFGYGFGNLKEAEKAALDGCAERAKAPCTIKGSTATETFYALAGSEDATGYAFEKTMNGAKKAALANCRERAAKPGTCKVTYSAHNPGPTPEPKSFNAILNKIATARNEQRPNTRTVSSRSDHRNEVSCHNQCTNGNCLRTFPDGRKERWQAPRVFDGATGDWKWDINSCGN